MAKVKFTIWYNESESSTEIVTIERAIELASLASGMGWVIDYEVIDA
jgi:hypothetical protein